MSSYYCLLYLSFFVLFWRFHLLLSACSVSMFLCLTALRVYKIERPLGHSARVYVPRVLYGGCAFQETAVGNACTCLAMIMSQRARRDVTIITICMTVRIAATTTNMAAAFDVFVSTTGAFCKRTGNYSFLHNRK